MSVALRVLAGGLGAVVISLAPFAIGFVIGWIMKKEKLYEYLKSLIIRLDNEGKLLDGEKEMLLKAVDEIKEDKKNDM